MTKKRHQHEKYHLDAGFWRLRFLDAQTEAEFTAFHADRLRQRWRIVFGGGVMVTIAAGIPEWFLLSGMDYFWTCFLRYGVLTGSLIVGLLLSFRQSFARWFPVASGAMLIALGCGFVMLSGLYPDSWDPVRFPGYEAMLPMSEAKFLFPQIVNICALAVGMSFGAIPLVASIPAAAAYSALFFVNWLLSGPSLVTVFYAGVLAIPAYIVTVLGAYRIERLQRMDFADLREVELAGNKKSAAKPTWNRDAQQLYGISFAAEAAGGVRTMLVAGIMLMTSAGFSEIVIIPDDRILEVVILRYGLVAPYLVLCFALTFTQFYTRHLDFVLGSGILVTCVGQLLVTSLYPGSDHFANFFGAASVMPANEGMFGFVQIFNLCVMLAAVATGAMTPRSGTIVVGTVLGTIPLSYYFFQPSWMSTAYILALTVPATALTLYGCILTEGLKRQDFMRQLQQANLEQVRVNLPNTV